MVVFDEATVRGRLDQLEVDLRSVSNELAVLLVFDRPSRVEDRPGAARTFFEQRCVSDAQLNQMLEAMRSVGAYAELFNGELPFIEALASGRIHSLPQRLKLAYNGIEGGIAHDGFAPGRKALIPGISDAYGILCSASDAQACAIGRHKFHYFTLLRACGVPCPETYHYTGSGRWAGGLRPAQGLRVITKSTYENWSIGVSESSVFEVDDDLDYRVHQVFEAIGQSVCVQQFIPGTEICVPILAAPDQLITPIVEVVLSKSPRDPEAVMTPDDNFTDGGIAYEGIELEQSLVSLIVEAVVQTFDVLELSAFARIDLRIDEDGQPWVFDVGVAPGLGRGGAAFASLRLLGFNHEQFLRIALGSKLAAMGLLS